MFGDIGGSEVILIMVVILIFFGANKIPELARGLGKGIREFKDASTEIRREFEQAGQPAQPNNYAQQNGYGPQNPYPAPQPAPNAETGSGFDPWATPAYVAPTADAEYLQHPNIPEPNPAPEPAPPVAHQLPPNMAPEGTQPRQPYIPANASPSADA
ncbi:twin-arginine translocase TatA/TatE family subunit [Hymenobacter sp. BT523]|uniref:Sec-independent protein translocase subunit TatA/TatB n=1 Tax=Hymenobacter sp. BT523 TaxID=2795725 RepID=UPI0018EA989F|nr:twin-arginine translocase TatA/TatE family subunit [Hymenobacter sp. BT523]MBJ6111127.1 twin-arginine translocase TatA/TatE family subunit [Hymenobacter sp. BT523]